MAGEAEPPRYKDTGHAAPGYCQRVIAAGADVLVAGTATFKGGPAHYAANIASLRG